MNLKKLKRLLSLTLTAAMVASMISVPVNAETVTDNTAAAMEEMIADPADEDVADDADGTDTADDVEDVADEKEDSDVADETENSDETEDEGTAEAAEEELFNAREAGDGSTGEGTGDSGTTTTPEGSDVIVVGDDTAAGQFPTLQAAIAEATKEGATRKKIELLKNAELTEGATLTDTGVEIDTKGHSIVIPAGANVTLKDAKITNSVAVKNCTILSQGTLTIVGGEYTTKGGQMFRIEGTANMSGATISCPQEAVTEENDWYDALPIISVHGAKGKLIMTSGTINADVGNRSNCGMYGISVMEGAEVILGEKNADNSVLTVNSMFSAIAMNGLTSPGRITVNSGTYNSSVSCTASDETKFNSVIYLPSTANVNINGGVFTETATENANAHVISIPYKKVGDSSVRLNLNISGGTFKSKGNVFNYADPTTADKVKVAISGGTFSSDLKNELGGTKGVVEGYEAYGPDANGMYTVSTTSVASVGTNNFDNLKDAVTAANNGSDKTVLLKKGIDLEESLALGEGVVVNTQGNMITIPEGVEVTLTGGTIKNEVAAAKPAKYGVWDNDAENRTMFHVDGKLTINGGTYQTAGVHMMRVSGTAVIGGSATLECTATQAQFSAADNYDGAPLISVTGKGAELTIADATINANKGNGTTDGMYGIYVNYGGKLVLGVKDGEAVKAPTITSQLAAIAMNGTTSPGTIVIEGGNYTSYAACTDSSVVKFNSVLYLPATANVTINGGTFTAAGTQGPSHVISVPYNVDPQASKVKVRLNLVINGGTFNVNSSATEKNVFFDAGMEDTAEGEETANRISIRGGVFNCEPKPAYVAGCHAVTKDNEENPTTWTVGDEIAEAHRLTWVARKKSTCWEEGVIGHYECLKCHKMYKTKTSAEELSLEAAAIPREEHGASENVEEVPAQLATCTEPGNERYFKCTKCDLCYETVQQLEADEKGTGGKPVDFAKPAEGHKYPTVKDEATQAEKPKANFDWSSFNYKTFKAGEANQVTAKRVCSVTTCSHEETAAKVSVELLEGTLEGTCEQGRTLKFKATAEFRKDAHEEEIEDPANYVKAEETNEITVDSVSHTYTKESVTFDWTEFNPSKFKDGTQKVTVKGTCSVCGKEIPKDTKVVVTAPNYPDTALICSESCEFTAVATFAEATDATPALTLSDKQELCGEHNLKVGQEYLAPTCEAQGRWGTLYCEDCDSHYLGEDSAKQGISVDPTTLTIGKRPHAFRLQGFSWMNKDTDTAKATFVCTSCNGTIEMPNLQATPTEGNPTVKCGDKVTWNYTVSVEFDKGAVEGNKTDGFTYNPENVDKTTEYKTTTLKKEVKQPHEFTADSVELSWMDAKDSDTEETVHEVSKGVKAIVTCSRANCGATVVASNKGGVLDTGTTMLDDSLIIPIVTPVLDEAKSTEATCVAKGDSVYNVNVSYHNGTEMKSIATKPISTKTNIKPDAHAWSSVKWSPWEKVTTGGENPEDVLVEVVATNGKTYKVPAFRITAERHCLNTGCTAGEGGENAQRFEGQVGSTEEIDKTKGYLEFSVAQRERTCTVSGRTTYTATAYYNNEEIEENLTPAVHNDPVQGHKIVLDWDWTPIRNGDGDDAPVVGFSALKVTRSCSECSHLTTEARPDRFEPRTYPIDIDPEKTESVNGNLKVTKEGNEADCVTPGRAIYTATLNLGDGDLYTNERMLVNSALDHDLRWYIEWIENTAENVQIDKKWSAKAFKKCERRNCPDKNKVPDKETVEVSYLPTIATCVTPSKDTWTAQHTLPTGDKYASEQLDSEGNVRSLVKEEVGSTDDNAHDYGDVEATVVWDEKTHENADGEEVLGVTFTRTCQREGGSSHVQKKTFEAKRVIAEGEKLKPDNCADGYTWNYKVSEEDMKTMTEPQPDATGVKDVAWLLPDNADSHPYVVAPAEGRTNHNLTRVAGGNSNDCTAQVHPTYFECKRCQKRYTSLTATTEYTGPAHEDTKPQGHLYGDPVFSWVEGENGRAVRATFTCMRSGCAVDAAGHSIELAAEFDPSVAFNEIEPECADTKNPAQTTSTGVLLEKGQGFAWGLVTLEITEENATDNLKVGDKWEGDLDFVLNPVDHHFVGGTCEWCDIAEGGVTVISHGRISTTEISKVYYSPEQLENIALPTPPNQLGYEFKGWSLAENGSVVEGIEDAIRAEAEKQTENKTVHVYAIYKKIVEKAVVKVTNACMSKNEAGETVYTTIGTGRSTEVILGERHEEEAVSPLELGDEGTYYFSHWERVDTTEKEDGTSVETVVIVGTDLTCELYIQTKAGVNLRAVYVLNENEAIGKEPSVEMTDIYGSVVGGVNKLSFASTISIPMDSNFEVREVGFLYSVSAKTILSEEEMTIANLGGLREDGTKLPHKQEIIDGTAKTNILTIQIPDAMADRTVYARPYVILRDTKSGQVSEPIYGAIVSKKFNEVAPAQPAAK